MADGAFPSLVSKDRNVNATSNPIYTSLVDAAGDQIAIDASGFLTVNVNGTVTVSASDLDIRDLTHVSDSVSIGDGTTLADVLDGTIDALYVALTDGTNTVLNSKVCGPG